MSALREVQEKVSKLNRDLEESIQTAESLKQQKEKAQVQLGRAEKLVSGLASEADRWKISAARLEEDLKNLTGNILLSAGFIAYLGPFTSNYRDIILEKWIKRFS